MEEEFWKALKDTPGLDWLVEAKRFLLAAEVLRDSVEYQEDLIPTPTLHLLAHGTELLLKANLIASGTSADDARTFRHDIWKLWIDDRNATLRADVLKAASEEWAVAKNDPRWQDTFGEDSTVLFQEHLKRLSDLHTNKTDYALRYARPEGTTAPRPHFLSSTIYRFVEQYLLKMAQ